jgi:5-methylthioadenosine/S-adenosylhomocysteine deaminase
VIGDAIVAAAIEIAPPHIVAVHPTDDPAALGRARGLPLDDHGERLIAPAFVNAHTHLALGFVRGLDMRAATRGNMVEEFFFTIEKRMAPSDVRAFARMGAYDSLLAGVGLVWDHYYAGDEIAGALADVGLAGVVAPTLQDLAGPGKDAWEAQLEATARIDGDAALAARGIAAAAGPHATDTVSEALFHRALDLCEARSLPLHVHVAQSPEEVERSLSRHGVGPLGWLDRIGVLDRAPATAMAHCIYASEAELARCVGGRHHLVWCPFSALVFGFPARVGWWSALGLSWAVATDCASNNDTMNVQQELRFVAAQRTVGASWSRAYEQLLAAGGDATLAWQARKALFAAHESLAAPRALLSRVWEIPGAIHPRLRAGVLAPGALANLLVIDLDHPAVWPAHDPFAALAMADATRAIWAMYVAGAPVSEPGAFHHALVASDAYRDAQREARARLVALVP